MNDTSKALGRYYSLCILAMTIYLTAFIFAIIYCRNALVTVFFALFYYLMKLIVRMIANKTIGLVLFKNLDAAQFNEIICNKWFVPSLRYRISGAISVGDYQTVVNIATIQMRQIKNPINAKYLYLSILAQVYFEQRDFKKLKILYIKYEEYKKKYPTKSFFKTTNSLWDYYRYFLEGNYEACMAICKKRNLTLNSKVWDYNYKKIYNDFYYAIACYENGDFEKAQGLFDNIITIAPQMILANFAQKYLDAIQSNIGLSIAEKNVLPEENYEIFDTKTSAKLKRLRIVKYIALVVGLISIIISFALEYIDVRCYKNDGEQYNLQIAEYERKLNDAISKHYDHATCVEYFNLTKDTVFVEAVCLVNDGNKLKLVSIVTSDESKTFDLVELTQDIDINSYHYVKSPVSSNYIGFKISTQQPYMENGYYISEFEFNGNICWIYIDYIGPTLKNIGIN